MLMKEEKSSDECDEQILFGSSDEDEFVKWADSLKIQKFKTSMKNKWH